MSFVRSPRALLARFRLAQVMRRNHERAAAHGASARAPVEEPETQAGADDVDVRLEAGLVTLAGPLAVVATDGAREESAVTGGGGGAPVVPGGGDDERLPELEQGPEQERSGDGGQHDRLRRGR
ncbi:hypothetical protein AURDEDRAFT_164435 [Auricularia subglabra TFB-10046 SS5]|nr:hypothetical protein AURDEDRAFT_164435 [Auricularia subglabra TFB-10046 SS5]